MHPIRPLLILALTPFFLTAGCGELAGRDAGSTPVLSAAPKAYGDFLPPPPDAPDSAETWRAEADEAARREGVLLRAGPRGEAAARDAQKLTPRYLEAVYGEVLGRELSKTRTPAVRRLIKRTIEEMEAAGRPLKRRYARQRPFVRHPDDETCRPDLKDVINPTTSYPSGHAAVFWGVGLALSDVFPNDAAALLARSREGGESRWICGHHWASDVEAGRLLASAVFANLMTDPDYRALLDAARIEAVEK